MVIGEQIFGFYQSAMQVMPNYTQIGQVLKQIEQPLPEYWQTPQDWLKQLETFKQQAPGLVELNIYQQSGILGYSVGIPRGALQQTFERGTPIRWIKSLNDQPIEIEKTSALLADLLDVDFIQAKQSGTVWPFVFNL